MDNIQTTLQYCIESARRGESQINVLDLMYETGLAYSDLQATLAALMEQKELVQLDIKTYEFIGDKNRNISKPTAMNPPKKSVSELDERRAYIEARRQEVIRRMQAETFDDDEEDDDDDGDNEEDDDEMDEDKLRYKALKLCIEKNTASVSLFQRTFPIGYIRSCKLIDWMESKGYVSVDVGSRPRKVLITQEEFDKIFNEPHCEEAIHFDLDKDDDQDDDLDKKLAKYEKFLEQELFSANDDEDNEEAEEDNVYDRLISHVFHSDADKKESEDSCVNIIDRMTQMQEFVTAIDKIADKKKEPISADVLPSFNLWIDEDEFGKVVVERIKWLIKSDKGMGQKGAVKKAETYLEAVRDTHDRKMVQVYERLVYELKNTSAYLYRQLKKQFFS